MNNTFTDIYLNRGWGTGPSVSGQGSDLEQTQTIRAQLPTLFAQLNIRSVLDIPSGDYYWFKEMALDVRYTGADIVPELVAANRRQYLGVKFEVLDICKDELPQVDLVLVRDLLGHFSNHDVQTALRNLRASGSKYLLSTTFPNYFSTADIKTGEWRPINLAYYYGLPDPISVINEGCTQGAPQEFTDKCLGLWLLND